MEPLLPERSETSSERLEHHRAQLMARIAAGEIGANTQRVPPSVPGYRLREIRGSGAAAEVWEAETSEGARVALKLFHARTDRATEVERALRRELHAGRRIEHPGIVRVLDTGETDDGRAFLVMALLAGVDLCELLARDGALPWSRAQPLLRQLCDALAYAHERGVVHRDLKPTNIMITPTDEGAERSVVVDLGLSRLMGDSVVSTIDGNLVGTPAYMSPEQIRGSAVDHRADIYALGCIAYEMLVGTRPYGGVTPGECAVQHLVASPPRVRVPGLGHRRRSVESVIHQAMAKEPSRRFADMRAFATALDRVDEQRRPRRRWWWIVPAGGVVLGLGAILARADRDRPEPTPEAARGSVPPRSPLPPRVVDLTLGLSHTCALSEQGQVTCWGIDAMGRLGRGTEGSNIGDNEVPADLPPLGLERVARVVTAPNARHVCALHRDGRLRCWGRGIHGALGQGSTATFGDRVSHRPEQQPPVALPGKVVDVVLSTARTCAIVQVAERRSLYCWGRGANGALGQGSTQDMGDDEGLDSVGPVPLGADVLEVAMGNEHTCARLEVQQKARQEARQETGAIRCWGSGAKGQLGVVGWSANIGDGVGDGAGRGKRPDDPTLGVQGLDEVEVVAMDAAGDRTCVLTARGGVRCWGSNQGGALGYRWDELPGCRADDPPTACNLEAPLPFDIDLGDLGGAKVVGLSTGQRHTCVVDERGRARCWGEGFTGRLGDGHSQDVGHWRSPGEVWRSRGTGGVIDVGDVDGDGSIDPLERIVAGMEHTCVLTMAGTVRCWGAGGEGRLGYASTDFIGLGLTPGDDYARQGVHDIEVFAPR
ncbi:MAG: protein kinase [Myxococcota bacterium]